MSINNIHVDVCIDICLDIKSGRQFSIIHLYCVISKNYISKYNTSKYNTSKYNILKYKIRHKKGTLLYVPFY